MGNTGDTKANEAKAFYDAPLREALESLWGEHLHPGVFARPDEALAEAQARATRTLAESLLLGPGSDVIEVACGVGAAARHLARRFGCRVLATNISARQLALGRALTDDTGLAGLVSFAEADFHALDQPDGRFDLWWCQESLLHSPDKPRVLAEARRVLRPGGSAVLSDLVVPRQVSAAERAKIYERAQSPGMWDKPDYDQALAGLGLEVVQFHDWSEHVAPSYAAMKALLESRRTDFAGRVAESELDRALNQLQAWVDFARDGKLGWVAYVSRAPDASAGQSAKLYTQ